MDLKLSHSMPSSSSGAHLAKLIRTVLTPLMSTCSQMSVGQHIQHTKSTGRKDLQLSDSMPSSLGAYLAKLIRTVPTPLYVNMLKCMHDNALWS